MRQKRVETKKRWPTAQVIEDPEKARADAKAKEEKRRRDNEIFDWLLSEQRKRRAQQKQAAVDFEKALVDAQAEQTRRLRGLHRHDGRDLQEKMQIAEEKRRREMRAFEAKRRRELER